MDTLSNSAVLTCSLELPKHYRTEDILAFHKRDALAIAESVDDHSLRKGLVWNNQAACLTIRFNQNSADAELVIDGSANADDVDVLYGMVRRMLGLNQQVEEFEQIYRNHPQIGLLIAQQPGLRVPTSATVFEALSWAITAQQISVKAAISIRRKLIQAAGLQHSSGLLCYPDATQLSKLSESDLRQAGFSQTKAQTLLALSRMIESGELQLKSEVKPPDVEEICRVKAAISIRRKLIQAAGLQHSSGLLCYPDATQLAKVSESDLRQAGFSQTKAQTLLALSRMIESGELQLKNEVKPPDVEEICRQLLQVRGIGPWTVNYALLRGFGWLDGSLHGDIAVRSGLQALLGSADKITEKQAQQWLAQFSPWRALVAAHLWAFFIRYARERRVNSSARNRG